MEFLFTPKEIPTLNKNTYFKPKVHISFGEKSNIEITFPSEGNTNFKFKAKCIAATTFVIVATALGIVATALRDTIPGGRVQNRSGHIGSGL